MTSNQQPNKPNKILSFVLLFYCYRQLSKSIVGKLERSGTKDKKKYADKKPRQ